MDLTAEQIEECRDNPTQAMIRRNELCDMALRAVPEGYVVVPKVPTSAMLEAMYWNEETMAGLTTLDDAYAAMLAAAPKVTP